MKDKLVAILRSMQAGPFLFVGSGFARRYVDLEDWKGLLARFCVAGHPYEYYLAEADGDLPKVAGLLAKDFNKYWWTAPEYADSRAANQDNIKGITTALRIEICNYLATLDQAKAKASNYADEIAVLAGLNVDGVITTNWDLLLEQIFPDYRVYIGQKELLFSNPQHIGEIYKIHGCSSHPDTLVLTDDDYRDFNERNTYLASKLITIFVEHPIIFIGYSLTDPNVSGMLKAIAACIGEENIEKLRRNLIFVKRLEGGDEPGISDAYISVGNVQIPLVLIKTNDLIPVYEALNEVKRKIPARVLRYCKEQLFELVKSSEPERKLCVVDFDEIDNNEDVEFLVGVGVRKYVANNIGDVGYAPIEAVDLINDVLNETGKYDSKQVVEFAIRNAGRNTKNVPVFKYLRDIGIDSAGAYKKAALPLDKWVLRGLQDFRVRQYESGYQRRSALSMEEIIETCTAENASHYITYMPKDQIDQDRLRQFLLENSEKLASTSPNSSQFRKLAVLYDKLRWGW